MVELSHKIDKLADKISEPRNVKTEQAGEHLVLRDTEIRDSEE